MRRVSAGQDGLLPRTRRGARHIRRAGRRQSLPAQQNTIVHQLRPVVARRTLSDHDIAQHRHDCGQPEGGDERAGARLLHKHIRADLPRRQLVCEAFGERGQLHLVQVQGEFGERVPAAARHRQLDQLRKQAESVFDKLGARQERECARGHRSQVHRDRAEARPVAVLSHYHRLLHHTHRRLTSGWFLQMFHSW